MTREGRDEMGMNPDGTLGQDEEGQPKPPAERDAAAPSPGGAGATAVFRGLPRQPAKGNGSENLERSLPVVHSVVFKADSSRAEGTDQLMNILRSRGSNADAAPAPAAPAASRSSAGSPAPAVSNGGFTQLLRALNYDQAKELTAAETKKQIEAASHSPSSAVQPVTLFPTQPVASAPSGSFTQLFETANSVEAEAAPAATPGSFTQMFQTLDAAAVPPSARLDEAEISATPERRAALPEPVAPPVASPGSFTQMFRALDSAPEEPAREAPQLGAKTAGPGSFTQMFAAVSSPAVALEPVRAESAPVALPEPELAPASAEPTGSLLAAGSFTQMFRALDAAPVETKGSEATPVAPAIEAAPVEPVEKAPPVTAASPSSFTQMFRTLDAAPAETARVEPPTSPSAAGGPGSFTQMFQAVGSPAVEPARREAAPAAAAPGAFTQMFSSLAAPAEPTRPEPQPETAFDSGSFTQMFRTLDATPTPEPPPREPLRTTPAFPTFANAPTRLDPEPSTQASGSGLTQLLRTLDQPAQTPSRPYPPPAAPAPPSGGQPSSGHSGGSFTSVYGTLGSEAPSAAPLPATPPPQQAFPLSAGRDATQVFTLPQSHAVPLAAPTEAGPSEFTRILSASTLRESGLRSGGPAGEAAAQTGPAAAGVPSAPSWQMPHAPSLPHVPSLPQAPTVPQLRLPEAPKVQVVGGMQQYLPLLLILVIFLLLAILVAVVFLMKR